MSPLVEWPGYMAVCDVCGANLVEELTGGEICAFADRDQAANVVTDADGLVIDLEDGGDVVVGQPCIDRYLSATQEEEDELETEAEALGVADEAARQRLAAWALLKRSEREP